MSTTSVAIIEIDDMILSPDQDSLPSYMLNSQHQSFKDGIPWPNAVVPYAFHADLQADVKILVRRAMDEIERVSCVVFTDVEGRVPVHHVLIMSGRRSASVVGINRATRDCRSAHSCQMMYLRDDVRYGNVLHELMHGESKINPVHVTGNF